MSISNFNFFADDQLIMTCTDFFMPTSVSTPMVVAFFLRQMIFNPQMKRRIQDEIENVVGRSRLPTLDDRNKYVTNQLFNLINLKLKCIRVEKM